MGSKAAIQQLNDWEIWTEMLEIIRGQATRTSFRTWFEPVANVAIDYDVRVIRLSSTEQQVNSVLNVRYLQLLESAAETVLKEPYRVIVELEPDIQTENYEVTDFHIDDYDSNLMGQYTFDNFIVGDQNKLAHGIALQVAKAPSVAFNPFFIYSNSGLGKTHLLHAIGNYVVQHDPQKKIIYVSSEEFTTDLVDSLRSKDKGRIGAFKKKYRGVDVLLIDDIQFLEGKPSTQEEFFHVFNDLYNKNKQIIICSDKEPAALTELEDRLRSRFQWNMVVGIAEPDFGTRVEILKNKAREKNVILTEQVVAALKLIADNRENIRELEGALTRVVGFSHALGREITPEFVREVLADIINTQKDTITAGKIKEAVSREFGVTIWDLDSSKRSREAVLPRHIAMYLCRKKADMSFKQIGREFGGRNHTTVMTACEKVEMELMNDAVLAGIVKNLL